MHGLHGGLRFAVWGMWLAWICMGYVDFAVGPFIYFLHFTHTDNVIPAKFRQPSHRNQLYAASDPIPAPLSGAPGPAGCVGGCGAGCGC